MKHLTLTAAVLSSLAIATLIAQPPAPADAAKGGAPKAGAPKAGRAPVPARIIDFKADKTTIQAGQPFMLIWATENPSAVTVEPDLGRVTPRGSRQLKATATTTYTLTVTGPNNQVETKVVTVTVPGTTPRVVETAAAGAAKEVPKLNGHPDLSGVWGAGGGGARGGRGGGGGPELKPGKDEYRVVRGPTDAGALADCMPLVGPQAFGVPYQFQIIQNADTVVLFYEYPGIFRIIPVDGTAHEVDPDPTWLGDGVGHWEGDTLVVDTIGFNTRTLVNGFKHSESLHIVEKFKRSAYDTIEYEATMEDPDVFVKSWTAGSTFRLRPDLRKIGEFVCENNKDYKALFVPAEK